MQKHDKYTVYADDGSIICFLNEDLVKRQGVTDLRLASIKVLHKERHGYIQRMKDIDPSEKDVLRWFAKKITEIDEELQKLWQFPVNRDYHKWWEVPHCVCGVLDAKDSYGTPYRHINGQCPVHGE